MALSRRALLVLLTIVLGLIIAWAEAGGERYGVYDAALTIQASGAPDSLQYRVRIMCHARLQVEVINASNGSVALRLTLLGDPTCNVTGSPAWVVEKASSAASRYAERLAATNGTTYRIPLAYYDIMIMPTDEGIPARQLALPDILEKPGRLAEALSVRGKYVVAVFYLYPGYFYKLANEDRRDAAFSLGEGGVSYSLHAKAAIRTLTIDTSVSHLEGWDTRYTYTFHATYSRASGLLREARITASIQSTSGGPAFQAALTIRGEGGSPSTPILAALAVAGAAVLLLLRRLWAGS